MVVAEAMHGSAPEEVRKLRAAIAHELNVVWSIALKIAMLNQASLRFDFRRTIARGNLP